MATNLKSAAKDAAKAGTEGAKKVAAEALAAGAVAAAGVVIARTAQALGTGAKQVEQAKPAAETLIQRAVSPSRGRRAAAWSGGRAGAAKARAAKAKKPARKRAAPKRAKAARRKKARR